MVRVSETAAEPWKSVLFLLKADGGIGIPPWACAGGLAVSASEEEVQSLAFLPSPESALEAAASSPCVQGGVWLFGHIPHSDIYLALIPPRTRQWAGCFGPSLLMG